MDIAIVSHQAHDVSLSSAAPIVGQTRRAPASASHLRNRRGHTRVRARGVASHLQTADTSIPGLPVENISMGGLFVRSSFALLPGTRVMLQVVRPGLKRAIEMTGRVVSVVSAADARVRGLVPGMGIAIDALDRDMEERLRALVDDLAGAAVVRREVAPAPATKATAPAPILDIGQAREKIEAQQRRIDQLEAELESLRREVSRRERRGEPLM